MFNGGADDHGRSGIIYLDRAYFERCVYSCPLALDSNRLQCMDDEIHQAVLLTGVYSCLTHVSL